MEIKISIEKPSYQKGTYEEIKDCVIVEFPNCISTTTNKSFKWMPNYRQLNQIIEVLKKVELESWNNNDRDKIPEKIKLVDIKKEVESGHVNE